MCVSGRVLFLGSMRRRKGEGVVYSLFPGYMCIPILPNPGLQLPGGAEDYNSAPNCHFRAGFDSWGDIVWSNYPVPEKAQPITQIPPSEVVTRYTQQKNTFPLSLYAGMELKYKTFSACCSQFSLRDWERGKAGKRMRHEGQTSFKMEKLLGFSLLPSLSSPVVSPALCECWNSFCERTYPCAMETDVLFCQGEECSTLQLNRWHRMARRWKLLSGRREGFKRLFFCQ